MKRKEFMEGIERLKKHDEFIDKLSDLGIELYENEHYDDVGYFFRKWIEEVFGNEGYDLVEWWLYENVEKKIYKQGTCSKEVYMKGEECDGEVIADLTEMDDLYDYLLVNYSKKGN